MYELQKAKCMAELLYRIALDCTVFVLSECLCLTFFHSLYLFPAHIPTDKKSILCPVLLWAQRTKHTTVKQKHQEKHPYAKSQKMKKYTVNKENAT